MIPSQLKPKYKPLVLIKADVWNTLKTKKLKKKKWRILIGRLKKRRYRKKSHLFDYSAKTVSKFPVYHRYKYQRNLIIKTKIKIIYGSLQDYKIKYLAKQAKNPITFSHSLEQKAPVFIYRLGLTSTYGEAKLHYIHKRIIVSGSSQELYIKQGDVLHFSPKLEKLFKRRLLSSFSKTFSYKRSILKLVGNNAVDFDPASFRFYFITNIKYYKKHPFYLPFEKTWRHYTRV